MLITIIYAIYFINPIIAVVHPATLPRTKEIDFPHAIIMATLPASLLLILPSILILGLVLKSFIQIALSSLDEIKKPRCLPHRGFVFGNKKTARWRF